MADLLLAIDVGNTNIVLGVYAGEQLQHSWRLATQRERTSDELGIWITQLFEHSQIDTPRVGAVVVASVVPPLTRMTAEMVERYFKLKPLIVDGETKTGMPILYENPEHPPPTTWIRSPANVSG